MVMALLDHYKNRLQVSAFLVALGCLCGLAPGDLAAQNVSNRQIQSMVQGASPQEIMERLRESGLSRSEVKISYGGPDTTQVWQMRTSI